MKTLLLFAIEAAGHPFDQGILDRLSQEQARHRALYRTETVRVTLGAQNALDAAEMTWQVCPEDGGMLESVAAQLATLLLSRMPSPQEGCEFALIGSGNAATGRMAILLGRIMTARLLQVTAVNTHLILLQDQLAFQDGETARLFQEIKACNAQRPPYYSTMYMLPWEPARREDTRRTVAALVKIMIMGGGHALGHAALRDSNWIETAAVTRLTPPAAQIQRKVFQHFTGEFNENVLSPALEGEGDVDPRTNDLQSCVHEIVTTLMEMERRRGLPSLEELYMIMPQRDPANLLTAKDALSPSRAWESIYAIYGDDAGRQLYGRMNPDMDALSAEYDAQRQSITVLLLNKVLSIGQKRAAQGLNCGFEQLPVIIDSIKLQVLKRLEGFDAGEDAAEKFAFSLLPAKSKAIAIARTRHMLLSCVYEDAQKNFGAKRAELRGKMFRAAADMAKSYLADCMLALKSEFDQMVSIRASRAEGQECFAYRLDDAYDHWCRRKLSEERVGLAEIYECFTESICALPYDEAARQVCDRLETLFDERTRAAADRIKAQTASFFSEMKFRDGLLKEAGVKTDNLNIELLAHLQNRLSTPPLMHVVTIEPPLKAVSRMFIIHRSGAAEEFASLASSDHDGTGILNDPYEDGVQMIVKYAGNALEDLVVYKNNRE